MCVHARQLFRENYARALRYTAITRLCAPRAILREKKFHRVREYA